MQTAQQAGIPKLYHYETLNLGYLEDMLVNNRIHVSNAGNVNDPWDCRPWFDKDVSDPNRRAQWATLFKPMMGIRSEEQRRALATLDPQWTDNAPFLSKTIDAMIASVVENNIKNWRMYCLTPDPGSILMWSHYSNKHMGVCLEFATGGNFFGGALEVMYRRDFLTIDPSLLGDDKALTDIVLLAKSQAWDYEREYRLLLRDKAIDPSFTLTCENEFLSLPVGALTAVIAGAKCSDADCDNIQVLLGKYARPVVLKRALRSPHKYDISVTP